MDIIIIPILILGTYIAGMIIGYKIGFIYGKFEKPNLAVKEKYPQKPKRHKREEKHEKHEKEELQAKKSIKIDEKKFVVDIKTAGMEKKYDSLGKLTKTNEDISNSVNKLKNLRKD